MHGNNVQHLQSLNEQQDSRANMLEGSCLKDKWQQVPVRERRKGTSAR